MTAELPQSLKFATVWRLLGAHLEEPRHLAIIVAGAAEHLTEIREVANAIIGILPLGKLCEGRAHLSC